MEWVELIDGSRYYFDEPVAPSIETIARALARIPRFGGHTVKPLSVARHSLHVYELVKLREPKRKDCQLWALLHDAHEIVVGDIPRPLKRWLDAKQIIEVQHTFNSALARSLKRVGYLTATVIDEADDEIMAAEASRYMASGGEGWAGKFSYEALKIVREGEFETNDVGDFLDVFDEIEGSKGSWKLFDGGKQ